MEDTLESVRNLKTNVDLLDKNLKKAQTVKDLTDKSKAYKDDVVTYMNKLRVDVDKLEMIVDKDMWPMPSYGDLFTEI